MARGSNNVAVKKTASTNGVAKKKKVVKSAAGAASDEEATTAAVEVVAIDDAPEAAPAAKPGPKSKKGKKSIRTMEPSTGSGKGRIRKAPERYEAENPPPVPTKKSKGSSGGSKEFPVEAIRGIRKEGGSYQFLVKWEGYAEKNNNWEPESNVRMCKVNIQKFLEQVTKHVNSFP